MAVLKYEFKISITQSHKSNDTLISRLLFRKFCWSTSLCIRFWLWYLCWYLRSLANVLSVLYMHCHYCAYCNKTLNGWTHSKWGRGQHLGPKQNIWRLPWEFQSRTKTTRVFLHRCCSCEQLPSFWLPTACCPFPLFVSTWMLQYTMIGYVKKELQLFLKCIAGQYMIDAVQTANLVLGAVQTQNGAHYTHC